jgi:hypothetical protein
MLCVSWATGQFYFYFAYIRHLYIARLCVCKYGTTTTATTSNHHRSVARCVSTLESQLCFFSPFTNGFTCRATTITKATPSMTTATATMWANTAIRRQYGHHPHPSTLCLSRRLGQAIIQEPHPQRILQIQIYPIPSTFGQVVDCPIRVSIFAQVTNGPSTAREVQPLCHS